MVIHTEWVEKHPSWWLHDHLQMWVIFIINMKPLFDYSWFEISSIPIQIPLWLNHQFDWLNSSKLANFPILFSIIYTAGPLFVRLKSRCLWSNAYFPSPTIHCPCQTPSRKATRVDHSICQDVGIALENLNAKTRRGSNLRGFKQQDRGFFTMNNKEFSQWKLDSFRQWNIWI